MNRKALTRSPKLLKKPPAITASERATLQTFDALILAMALDEAKGEERQVIEKWRAARNARDAALFS